MPAVAVPAFSPVGGTFAAAQTVSLSDSTPGATIYYTVNGSTPTTASTPYSGAITVSTTTTLSAIAAAAGDTNSAVASALYTINLPPAATPTFSPAAGTYNSAQTVTLSDASSGAAIYYTLDGSAPTSASAHYSVPITVSATETINAIAIATGYTQSATGCAAYTIAATGPTVAVTLSTYDSKSLLAPQATVQFGSSPVSSTQLLIDENQQFQTLEGFGASFTDAAAYDLWVVETPSLLAGTLSDLFTTSGNGIGLSFMRVPIGASDMSRSIYTFDDMPAGQTDVSLSQFSIAHDQTYIIPLMQAAKALNQSMKLMASPWSPPAWMKTTQSIEGGSLNDTYDTSFANYLVKYLQAYKAVGLAYDYLSIENEPLNSVTGYPSMLMPATQELPVIRDYVLPALSASGLSTRVLLYDHNWDTPSYPASLLTDPTLFASPVIAGTAWHGYSGPEGAQLGVQNQYPAKGQWETEHSGGTFVNNQFISDFNEITLVMRNAGKSYVKWNLALDQNRGPNTSQLGGSYTGCNTCSGLITVDSNSGMPTKTIEYYTLGQYSKFIKQGAIRVWSSDTPVVVSSAYINPDGTRVLVVFNNSFANTTFQVQWGTQNFTYTLSAYAAATFVWSGTQTGTPTQSATQQIQGASFTTGTGFETEETTDATGSYDLGYVVDGATASYKNVNFGNGISQVNVRIASGGNGGTVEFHLDSPTGTLLGTTKLVVTGGYQTWQTVTTPVVTTSGVHDLYLILHGSGGIGNINWFQFQ
jgi:glucosylceramidase